jgi:leucyl aminopeptidase
MTLALLARPTGWQGDRMPLPEVRTAPRLAVGEAASVLVVLVGPDAAAEQPVLPGGLGAVLETAGGPAEAFLVGHLARASSPTRAGASVELPLIEGLLRSVLLVGHGDATTRSLRQAGAAVGRTLRDRRPGTRGTVVVAGLGEASSEGVRAFVEGLSLAAYVYRYAGTDAVAADVLLLVPDSRVEAVRRAQVTARAVHLARDLANTPSLTKTPAWLAERAVEHAPGAVHVSDEVELAARGFGGILAVGMGSVRPPRLVELTYTPARSRGERLKHVVLVGKGITFDSGGISLKPSDGMIAMKTDMAGAGAVLSVISALPALDVRVRVTGLLACAENMPSGSAMRPSDVITHYGGRTVEVLNTDAEGRLVLADCLAYADSKLHPDAVVDVATLTGAVSVALGKRDAALFSNDDDLARALEAASASSGERVWRMPLVEDYRPAVESTVADLTNVPEKPARFSGGSIVAALFLREFAGARPWAHLDIAGTGRADADADELTKGATGYGVRLLLRYLESFA